LIARPQDEMGSAAVQFAADRVHAAGALELF
jgi:hypothetical protein